MHKEIEKAISRITQAIEKNRKAYIEADGNYRDTGYDRYWNKMQKLDAEYEELKAFLHPEEKIEVQPDTILKLDELQHSVKNIKSKWDYICQDFNLPATPDVIGINDIFRDIKHLLN